jgi:hypothetical protein
MDLNPSGSEAVTGFSERGNRPWGSIQEGGMA